MFYIVYIWQRHSQKNFVWSEDADGSSQQGAKFIIKSERGRGRTSTGNTPTFPPPKVRFVDPVAGAPDETGAPASIQNWGRRDSEELR